MPIRRDGAEPRKTRTARAGRIFSGNGIVAAGTLAGIATGLAATAAGSSGIASAAWAATTAAALAPLTITLARDLRKGKAGVDLIALLAMGGALLLHQYLAGAVIALMFAGGKALEDFAEGRASRELSGLLERAPREVNRYEGEELRSVPLDQVRPDDRLLVKPGEVVPVDGVLTSAAVLDEAALTGEAKPVTRQAGESVRSGVTNCGASPVELRASATAEESTYAGIIRLVSEAQSSKAPIARLADRYALIFVPVALTTAALAWIVSGDPVRGLAVLVIATPCPLILAAPIAIVGGISRATHRGIIVKGGGALEALARARVLILDKTGTVTTGSPVVTNVETFGHLNPDRILQLAASLDQVSRHVLAGPIIKAARERNLELKSPEDVQEEFGSGIRGRVNGNEVAVGKSDWVLAGAAPPEGLRTLRRRLVLEGASAALVAVDGQVAGALILEDPVRPDAALMIRSLRQEGFRSIVMLTGDHGDVAEPVGAAVGVDRVLAECSPAMKVQAVNAARAEGPVVMAGDGINDAPALAAADVGVALGARGATAASEAADVVLLVDRVDRLTDARRIARRSRLIAIQSIVGGMALSIVGMGFGAFGWLSPVAGAVLQEGIDVLAVMNALRALGGGERGKAKPAQARMARRIRREHERLLPGVKQIRAVADRLDSFGAERLRSEVGAVQRFLTGELIPHEKSEDATFYPMVASCIGGQDPTAPMSRAHAQIESLAGALQHCLQDLRDREPVPDDLRDLRRILYGLDAILRLHFVQEDESYVALVETQHQPETSGVSEVR